MNVLSISLEQLLLEPESSRRTGDAWERQQAYAERLARYDVVVLTRSPRHRSPVQLAPNSTVYAAFGRLPWSALRQACGLAETLVRRTRYDVVTVQDPWGTGLVGWWLKRRCGLPLNVQLHVDVLTNAHWLRERWSHHLRQRVARCVLRQADSVRCVNTVAAETVRGFVGARVPVRAIPVAVASDPPVAWDQVLAWREAMLKDGGTHLVVFGGRLVAQKDPFTLLEAVPQLAERCPGVRVALCGAGPLQPRLERQVAGEAALRAHVRLLGPLAHTDLMTLLASSDVVVLPSLYEGLPQLLLEAAAIGRPMVATATPGACELIEHGTSGYLVPPRAASALADRLAEVLEHPESARRMGARARERFQVTYGRRDLTGEMVELLAATAQRRRHGAQAPATPMVERL